MYLSGTLRNIITMALFVKGYRSFCKPFGQAVTFRNLCTSMTRRTSTSSSLLDEPRDTPPRTYDLKGLQSEIIRQKSRACKKIMKQNEKLQSDKPGTNDGETTPEEALQLLEERLNNLNHLEESLKSLKSSQDSNFALLIPLINKLNLTDTPPVRPERTVKAPKTKPQSGPRKPYHIYQSCDGITLFVGKKAEDNDELSCNPQHRDNKDWWLHVADFAGSHVVIRNQDNDLPKKFKETVLDAAVLAVANSKAKNCGKVTVHLTRCGNVSKPRGAKAGLVHITGDIKSVVVNMKVESKRLERLVKIDPTNEDSL